MKKLKLTASVNVRKADRGTGTVTDVTVRIDGRGAAVVFGSLGGSWTAEQALKEFRKTPKRFQVQPGYTDQDVMVLIQSA